jgi:uncharacterized protein (TIGR00255 family)
MLHSMTGFARQSVATKLGTLSWEVRAVNHRYLELQFRLPDELRPKEQAFRKQVGATIKRGKIDCALHFQRAFDQQNDLQVNAELLQLVSTRLAEISSQLPATAPINPVDILRWPGVLAESGVDAEPLFVEACDVLDRALADLASMRASEGERIAAMLESRCADIATLTKDVESRMPLVLDAARHKQRERIAKLNIEADPGRLEVELALIAQKLDVAEEIDRLNSHITEIRQILKSDEPVGRRLDFLMQELNREANTLGSKSADTDTTRAAVELKVLIEQMREQIQNVE